MNNQPQLNVNREVRRSGQTNDATEQDIKIAIDMEKNGTPIPESLKTAVEEFKKGSGNADIKKNEDEPGHENGDQPKTPKTPEKEPEGGKKAEDEEDELGDKGTQPKTPVVVTPVSERPVRFMPVGKHTEIKKELETKLNEAQSTIGNLTKEVEALKKASNTGTEDDFKKKLTALADKAGIPEEALIDIISLATGKTKDEFKDILSPEVVNTIKGLGKPSEEERQAQVLAAQDKLFDSEFEESLKDLDPAEREIAKRNKESIKEFAFTEGYEKKSIWEIYTRFVKPKLNKSKNVDLPDGSVSAPISEGDSNWEEIAKDPAKIRDLTPAQAEKFQAYMASKSPRIIRRR